MSRIGNKPIAIPAGVTVQVDGSTVTVKGAKGELTRTVHSNMAVEVEGATVHVKRPDNPMRISAVKKDIARIKTVQRDIELHGANS